VDGRSGGDAERRESCALGVSPRLDSFIDIEGSEGKEGISRSPS
jgi:hypothetical protein